MKTSTSGQADTCPAGPDKTLTQTGSSGAPHLEVAANGTETGSLGGDKPQTVFVHDGISLEDLPRLARKVAPNRKVRLADGSVYEMGLGAHWTKLHGPPADL